MTKEFTRRGHALITEHPLAARGLLALFLVAVFTGSGRGETFAWDGGLLDYSDAEYQVNWRWERAPFLPAVSPPTGATVPFTGINEHPPGSPDLELYEGNSGLWRAYYDPFNGAGEAFLSTSASHRRELEAGVSGRTFREGQLYADAAWVYDITAIEPAGPSGQLALRYTIPEIMVALAGTKEQEGPNRAWNEPVPIGAGGVLPYSQATARFTYTILDEVGVPIGPTKTAYNYTAILQKVSTSIDPDGFAFLGSPDLFNAIDTIANVTDVIDIQTNVPGFGFSNLDLARWTISEIKGEALLDPLPEGHKMLLQFEVFAQYLHTFEGGEINGGEARVGDPFEFAGQPAFEFVLPGDAPSVPAPVPLPATALLLGAALAGLGAARSTRRR